MDKISVIIPVYNVEQYLCRCLDSLLSQSYSNLEIICIDDCSSDSSYQILVDYEKKDSRFIIVRNEENLNSAETRNKGLLLATGEYVYFLDSDDWIDENYLEEMVEKFHHADVAIVFNNAILCESFSKKYDAEQWKSFPKGTADTIVTDKKDLSAIPCPAWCKLFKREFLLSNQLFWSGVLDDYILHFKIMAYAKSVLVYYGNSYYHYFDNVTGISKNKREDRYIMAFENLYSFYKERNLLDKEIRLFYLQFENLIILSENTFARWKSFFYLVSEFAYNHSILYDYFDFFVMNLILESENFDDYKKKTKGNIMLYYLQYKNKNRKFIDKN